MEQHLRAPLWFNTIALLTSLAAAVTEFSEQSTGPIHVKAGVINNYNALRRGTMQPKEVVLAWIEAFNQADCDALVKFYADDATNHQVAEQPVELALVPKQPDISQAQRRFRRGPRAATERTAVRTSSPSTMVVCPTTTPPRMRLNWPGEAYHR